MLKPASDTPLSALALVEILLEAGLPPLAIACITGSGGSDRRRVWRPTRGCARSASPAAAKSASTSCSKAGLKRVTMELGSNSPVIVMDDADLNKAAEAIVATGYANAGQVCISAQRVMAVRQVYDDLLDVLKPKVAAHRRPAIQLDEQNARWAR